MFLNQLNYKNSLNVSIIRYIFNILNMIVKTQAIILIHVLFVNSFPIILGLLVANVKGIILKGNARLKNTCVKIKRSSILEVLEPYNH